MFSLNTDLITGFSSSQMN